MHGSNLVANDIYIVIAWMHKDSSGALELTHLFGSGCLQAFGTKPCYDREKRLQFGQELKTKLMRSLARSLINPQIRCIMPSPLKTSHAVGPVEPNAPDFGYGARPKLPRETETRVHPLERLGELEFLTRARQRIGDAPLLTLPQTAVARAPESLVLVIWQGAGAREAP
jgi:hypothetical protein